MVVNRDDVLLTTSEVAEMLHYHVNTVRRFGDQGVIRSCRIGSRGDRRYFRRDVLNFLANQQNPG
jgi:excisionase family DNA binding protein